MPDFNINKKNEFLIVLILVLLGFSLRLYASFTVPLVFDETEKINFSRKINFGGDNFNLPLGSNVTRNPPLLPYLIKISTSFFGENKIAIRLPSVLLGSLTLLILYFLVRTYLNKKTAMLCLILTTFSQFLIGSSRIAWEDGILPFFTVSVIFLIQKALYGKRKSYLMWAGMMLGLGLMVKTTFIMLLPMAIVYLFLYPNNKNIFSAKDLVFFLLIIAILISPNIYWNITNDSANYIAYTKEADFFTFSLIPLALFLGEIVVFGMRNFDDSIFYWIFSYEYPFLNWLMGLICVGGGIYFLRNKKNDFTRLLLWIFCFIFIFFSFVRARSGGGYYFHLDNFWWAVVAVIPGFILGSAMLVELSARYKAMKFILPAIIIYFIFNAVTFVNFPANCFIPRDSIKAKELFDTAREYAEGGEGGKAAKVYDYIEKKYPKYLDRRKYIEINKILPHE